MDALEAEAINAAILDKMRRVQRALPRLPAWAALRVACAHVAAQRNGTNTLDPDPTGEIAHREEVEYSHLDDAHA